MTDFLFRPRRIPSPGDDTPAASLFGYVWRMSGRHQLWICLLAVVAFISGFERLATPLRELIAYYRIAAQANVQHKMIARWM